MPNSKYRTKSRRETPWTYKQQPEKDEKFIDDCINKLYHDKHPDLKGSGEAELLNSIVPEKCPHCNHPGFQCFGKTENGINRYRCKSCRKTFTITTKTLLANHRIPVTEWIEFLLGIFRSQSFASISKANRNSETTTGYWLAKLYLILENYQDGILLQDEVQIDETFYSVIKKDLASKEDGTLYRGLSRNKICMGIGCDNAGHVYCKVEGFGKPTKRATMEIFKDHIKKGSKVVHDMEKSHAPLVNALELISTTYNSESLKGLPDKDNPLTPINTCCRELQDFLHSHKSFQRSNLPDYLNLFAFIHNPPHDPHEKIKLILKWITTTLKTLSYREKWSN